MKLIIGNKNYSSWSLRGWLACKQAGLSFEEILVPLFGEDWDALKKGEGDLTPSSGKVPVLWDGDDEAGAVVWDSLAILEYLADKVGRDRFWPKDDAARAMARAMVAEMHSSYLSLRRECPMNIRVRHENVKISEATRQDVVRILGLRASAAAARSCSAPSARRTSSTRPWSAASSPMASAYPASRRATCRRSGRTTGCNSGSLPPRTSNG